MIEANKRNIKSIFYIRHNRTDYADLYNKNKFKILETYIKIFKLNIDVNLNNLFNEKGIIIMVDGDIYGPPKKFKKDSLLFKLNPKSTEISLQEHMNFNWSYEHYIDYVNYCVFPNISYAKLYNKISNKNLYLGNTKYDNIFTKSNIYKKYRLKKHKYALILFPKISS